LGDLGLLNSTALTIIQSIILIAVIVVAAVGGGVAYFLLRGPNQSSETIKIGILAGKDGPVGKSVWQGINLAVEQINAEGGILGRNFTVFREDDGYYSAGFDPTLVSTALNRLISVHKVDFIICIGAVQTSQIIQEISAEHKKIVFITYDNDDALTQKVLDNYDKYKYFFRTGAGNGTSAVAGIIDSLDVCREITGFNKIAVIYPETWGLYLSPLIDAISDIGFDVVLYEGIALDDQSLDFSSTFARVEATGAEILYPFIGGSLGIPFVKEYYDRQSPMILWGGPGEGSEFWQSTDGKCECVTVNGFPVVVGIPLTNKTIPTKEAYEERWEEEISSMGAIAYDTIRFILADAIERAGTTETEAMISALEDTDTETSICRRFVFTPSHDVMVGKEGPNKLSEDYFFVAMFQYQDGEQVPVYPKELMEEAGATYMFPDWPGPWDTLG
jgi:branched-chain amino acid transport system substrate-binding protein